MIRLIPPLLLCMHLLMPIAVWAQARVKDPSDYSLRTYAVVLGAAIFGGLVSWHSKVRAGEVPPWSIGHLIGEISTSAFAGLICFWVCEGIGLSLLLSAAFTGIAGHMGARAISLFEEWALKRANKVGP